MNIFIRSEKELLYIDRDSEFQAFEAYLGLPPFVLCTSLLKDGPCHGLYLQQTTAYGLLLVTRSSLNSSAVVVAPGTCMYESHRTWYDSKSRIRGFGASFHTSHACVGTWLLAATRNQISSNNQPRGWLRLRQF